MFQVITKTCLMLKIWQYPIFVDFENNFSCPLDFEQIQLIKLVYKLFNVNMYLSLWSQQINRYSKITIETLQKNYTIKTKERHQ